MRDLNKIILIGRLGNEPIQRETKNGTPVTQFSLATARKTPAPESEGDASKNGGGEAGGSPETYNTETIWHNVVVWGRQAESCAEYLTKGQTVYVEGSIRKRSYKSKEGEDRVAFEVHADSVGFLGVRKKPESSAEVSA